MLYGGSYLNPVSIYKSLPQYCTVQSYQLFMGLGKNVLYSMLLFAYVIHFSGQRHTSVQSCFEVKGEDKYICVYIGNVEQAVC